MFGLVTLRNHVFEVKQNNNSLANENKKLENENEKLENENEKLENENKKLENENEKLKNENKKLENENKRLENENKKLENENKQSMANQSQLYLVNNLINAELIEIKDYSDAVNKKNVLLYNENNNLRVQIKDLLEKICTLNWIIKLSDDHKTRLMPQLPLQPQPQLQPQRDVDVTNTSKPDGSIFQFSNDHLWPSLTNNNDTDIQAKCVFGDRCKSKPKCRYLHK